MEYTSIAYLGNLFIPPLHCMGYRHGHHQSLLNPLLTPSPFPNISPNLLPLKKKNKRKRTHPFLPLSPQSISSQIRFPKNPTSTPNYPYTPTSPSFPPDPKQKQKPFHLNPVALLQFLIYGLLSVLPNFIWQRYLETHFPGFPSFHRLKSSFFSSSSGGTTAATTTPSPPPPKGEVYISIPLDTDLKEKRPGLSGDKGRGNSSSSRFLPRKVTTGSIGGNGGNGVRNFLAKFLLDQTVGSVMNIVLFVVLINWLKGVSLSGCWGLVLEDFRPIMMARLKYRPLVSVLMYTVVPADRRVVFGSACGVIWGVYLSLYAVV
ncbi:uncharacterized protein BP01DRAFT_356875 [Aspergillus saccharolyticus JOP 1030-1]|uniref:Integral membrane protein, Mpv17/PMP22 family n=1 Tax=Aspergillus saccharolyticus JOP 1030-1 TaxID=1450539 RepID=A0A319AET9_9EURO|nr:hypothetical protein BP01DRAFT_356875 [Aspergillus saccharolyticus JOP 1030-1]PYH45372.1 hypothetical protein BP01DRAFT_356875 [Aspergillus saccharolyticus JOP 1030-1]